MMASLITALACGHLQGKFMPRQTAMSQYCYLSCSQGKPITIPIQLFSSISF